jgi:hypothetical protein
MLMFRADAHDARRLRGRRVGARVRVPPTGGGAHGISAGSRERAKAVEPGVEPPDTVRMRRLLLLAGLLLGALSSTSSASAAGWVPPAHLTWYWQLDGPLKLNQPAELYDVDGFGTSTATVSALHASGKHVVCYVSAGTSENWRADFRSFPAGVQGANVDGWAGERWLDVRQWNVLGPIVTQRVAMCAGKGFDAVEFDNVDGYQNASGFPLTAADQLTYNRRLAAAAHAAGLLAVLKNDVDQVAALAPDFDIALNEECAKYNECDVYSAFLSQGKPVLQAEYGKLNAKRCAAANTSGRMTVYFNLALNGKQFLPCW